MTRVTNWLETHATGFRELDQRERDAIADFSLLWSLFELRILDNRGSITALYGSVDEWASQSSIDENLYAEELQYFRERYLVAAHHKSNFIGLRIDNPKQVKFIQNVLSEKRSSKSDCLKACLVIVYRYRNNLLHGEKWKHGMEGELSNFHTANSLLMKLLDRFGTLQRGEGH